MYIITQYQHLDCGNKQLGSFPRFFHPQKFTKGLFFLSWFSHFIWAIAFWENLCLYYKLVLTYCKIMKKLLELYKVSLLHQRMSAKSCDAFISLYKTGRKRQFWWLLFLLFVFSQPMILLRWLCKTLQENRKRYQFQAHHLPPADQWSENNLASFSDSHACR